MNKGKIFYASGSIILMAMGLGHFFGQFGPKPLDIQRAMIEEAMRSHRLQDLGFQYSMMDVMQCWGVFFGVLTIIFGTLNVLILFESLPPVSMIRFSVINLIAAAVLMTVGAMYVPFTAIGFSVIVLCFLASAVLFYQHRKE